MAILDFSVSRRHGFGSVTQVCFGISVSNFMCMSFVAVGRSLMIVSYVAFKMAALWFWTMFNCNPPIAHCHPLLWGGGILVDHWSTISSFSCPSVRRCEAWNTIFPPVHVSIGPFHKRSQFFCLSICPSIWIGLWPIPGKQMNGITCSLAWWCILTTFITH